MRLTRIKLSFFPGLKNETCDVQQGQNYGESPGLKAHVLRAAIQWPDGPCSLHELRHGVILVRKSGRGATRLPQ